MLSRLKLRARQQLQVLEVLPNLRFSYLKFKIPHVSALNIPIHDHKHSEFLFHCGPSFMG